MPEEHMNTPLRRDENAENNENRNNMKDERFESDTQRIIHRHLENKDDLITDEDIAGVRIGMTPPLDEATEARFKGEEAREEAEGELLEGTEDMKEDKNLEEGQITPWDAISPE